MSGCLQLVVTRTSLDGDKYYCPCALEAGHEPPCLCRHHVKDLAYRAKKANEPDKRQWKENA